MSGELRSGGYQFFQLFSVWRRLRLFLYCVVANIPGYKCVVTVSDNGQDRRRPGYLIIHPHGQEGQLGVAEKNYKM